MRWMDELVSSFQMEWRKCCPQILSRNKVTAVCYWRSMGQVVSVISDASCLKDTDKNRWDFIYRKIANWKCTPWRCSPSDRESCNGKRSRIYLSANVPRRLQERNESKLVILRPLSHWVTMGHIRQGNQKPVFDVKKWQTNESAETI